MKFSSLAVLTVVAPLAAGFATTSNQRQFAASKNVAFVKSSASSSTRRGSMSMDVSDLESRLFEEKKSRPAPAPRKPRGRKEPEPAPVSEPTPATAKAKSRKKEKKEEYDLSGLDVPKKVKPAPAPRAEKPKRAPAPAPAPKDVKPKVAVVQDPNAVPAGVALGAAPLLLAPLALLAGGRSVLSGTKARREKIQKEIDTFEAAKQKKQIQADVDGGELTTALVRFSHR
jgi:outer membrane biosynthesis protein TonB